MSPPKTSPRTEDGVVREKTRGVKCRRRTRTPSCTVCDKYTHTRVHLLHRILEYNCVPNGGSQERLEDEKEGKVMDPRGR